MVLLFYLEASYIICLSHTIRLDIGVVYNEGFIYGYSLGCCLEDMLTFVEVSYCLWYVPEMRSQV